MHASVITRMTVSVSYVCTTSSRFNSPYLLQVHSSGFPELFFSWLMASYLLHHHQQHSHAHHPHLLKNQPGVSELAKKAQKTSNLLLQEKKLANTHTRMPHMCMFTIKSQFISKSGSSYLSFFTSLRLMQHYYSRLTIQT